MDGDSVLELEFDCEARLLKNVVMALSVLGLFAT
jgi:hypothetical protein